MDTISHNTLLFNVHDFVLLLSAVFSLILAVTFFLFAYRNSNQTNVFLATIFFLFMAQSINTLIIWSPPVRSLVLNWEPNLFFWGGLGYWLQGPLLFWVVSSIIEPNFKLSRLSALHIIPTIVVATLIVINYHLLSKSLQIQGMRSLIFLQAGLMDNIISARYLSIIGYGGVCLGAVSYKLKSLSEKSEYQLRLYLWLKLGISSSILMAIWPLFVHLTSNRISLEVSNALGLGTNYLCFFFVTAFLFTTLRYSQLIHPTKVDSSEPGNAHKIPTSSEEAPQPVIEEPVKAVKPELINHIEHYMAYKKPFLIHNINIEMLAARLSLPERTLSRAINQHFEQNFVEFINSYRIVEAKKLLCADFNNQKSILTIMDEAGFNSKSTFNATFKQQVGMTPSQFKKKKLLAFMSSDKE